MKRFGKIVTYLLLAFNAFLVGMLVLSAYSSYLNPKVNHLSSCLGLIFPFFLVANLLFLFFWLFVRWRYAFLSLVGMLVCFPQIRTYIPLNSPVKELPDGCIKLLSYNTMSFGGLTKKEGKNPVLSYIADSGADIVCLQEYSASGDKSLLTEKDIRKAMKAYPYRSVCSPSENGAQLACFSKFPILSVSPIRYKSIYNGSVKYELVVKGDTLTLINNHFESNKLTKEDRGMYEDIIKDPDAHKVKTGLRQLLRKLAEASAIRASQVDSVEKVIGKRRYPTVVVCGDFNDSSISYTHRIMARGLDDAFTQSGRGLGISYNQNKFYFRIDNILVSPDLKTYNCTVDRSIRASDHYPIWCYIEKR